MKEITGKYGWLEVELMRHQLDRQINRKNMLEGMVMLCMARGELMEHRMIDGPSLAQPPNQFTEPSVFSVNIFPKLKINLDISLTFARNRPIPPISTTRGGAQKEGSDEGNDSSVDGSSSSSDSHDLMKGVAMKLLSA
ncbi:hypothetical protein HAX54_004477, partial [Datura stramonium]|nr:hypothetical protein [Datura stramonium]